MSGGTLNFNNPHGKLISLDKKNTMERNRVIYDQRERNVRSNDFILQATEMETDKLVKSIAGITEKGGEIAMTTAEKLRQEGLQKGRQEGRQENIE